MYHAKELGHRGVRVLEQRLRIPAVIRIEREPEAAAHVDFVPLDGERATYLVQDLVGHPFRRTLVGQILQHRDELVARDAREHVALPQRRADPA